MIRLADAQDLAEELFVDLAPYCHRLEIAGSVRRGRADVHDIELVALPREPGLLQPGLPYVLDMKLQADRISHVKPKRWGERYRAFMFKDVQIDLFMVRLPASWGIIYTVRTGPAAHSQALATRALGLGMRVKDGQLWRDGQPVPTPEEEHFYMALGMEWVRPEDRR